MRCLAWVGHGMVFGMVQTSFRYRFASVSHTEGLSASRRAVKFVCGKETGRRLCLRWEVVWGGQEEQGGAGSGKGGWRALVMGWLVAWGGRADVQVDAL